MLLVAGAVLRWLSSSRRVRTAECGSIPGAARSHEFRIGRKGAFIVMTRMLVRIAWLLAVLTCFLVGTVSAQQIQPPKLDYEKIVLANGLNLILHEDHTIPIVAVNLWYHVGSKNEVEGRTGFAHLFEHMMFQGSENHNTDFFYALDAIGATDRNGTTNFDRTNYFENVPTSALEQVLWLEADRMGWLLPAMTQERLDNQIEVVKNERRQGVDNQPYGTVDERMYAALYPKAHPYSWDVIGYMEDLTAATKDDVEGFFKAYYGPNNCTLVVAGDIDKATVKEQVEKYFGPIAAGPPIFRKDTWIPELQKEIRLTMEDRVPLPRLYMAWHAPANYASGEAELDVLAGVLSNGKTSRLYKRLVYDLQIAQDVNAYVDERELGSLFYVRVTAKEGRTLEEIEPIVREEIALIQSKGVTKLEVERVVTQALSGKVRGLQRIGGFGGKSDMLARYNTYLGDPDYIEKDFARYNAITPADVRAAAQRWLHAGVCVMSVTPFPEMTASTDTVDRTIKPQLTEAPPLTLPQLQRKTLSNGLEVVLAELHKTPLVQFDLQVKGGWSADTKGAYGMASFTSRMQDEGTRKRTALQISEEAQLLGATMGSGSDLDNCSVSMNALVARLDESLDLFSDVVLNPSFPEEELERQRQQVLGQILQEKRQPVGMGIRILPVLIYGDKHPYGQPLTGSGTEASVNAIQREDLVKFHDEWFRPNNATLVIVGDTTLEEIVPKLEAAFAGWKSAEVPSIDLPIVPQPAHRTVYIVDKPGAAQSVLLAGHLMPPKSDANHVAFEVLNAILGGEFTSRINMNLREDKGYTYGAFTFPLEAKGQGLFAVFSQVRTDVTRESLVEVMKELSDIRGTRPVTPEELLKSQSNLVLQLSGNQESLGEISNSIQDLVTYDLPDDYMTSYTAAVQSTTTEGLTKLAQDWILPENLAVVVVGDRAVIEAEIRKLNLGPIEFLDENGNRMTQSATREE